MNATRMSAIEDGAEPSRFEVMESLLFAAGAFALVGLGTAGLVWSILGVLGAVQ